MSEIKNIVILGRTIPLQERSKAQMKGATVGDLIAYRFFDGVYLGVPMLFAEPKGAAASPQNLSITASNLTSLFNLLVQPTHRLLACVLSGLRAAASHRQERVFCGLGEICASAHVGGQRACP